MTGLRFYFLVRCGKRSRDHRKGDGAQGQEKLHGRLRIPEGQGTGFVFLMNAEPRGGRFEEVLARRLLEFAQGQ